MPEAFIFTTTSPGPGVGSGKLRSSMRLLPRNTAPRTALPAGVVVLHRLPGDGLQVLGGGFVQAGGVLKADRRLLEQRRVNRACAQVGARQAGMALVRHVEIEIRSQRH